MDKRYGILIVGVTILVLWFVGTASATNWSVDGSGGTDFTGIQDAINNAYDGDTIIVHAGIYYENVVVNKSVTLMGDGQPVVDADGEGDAIRLNADGIKLEGFTIANSGRRLQSDAGIYVISNNNTITGNNVSNNKYDGIHLSHSSNNNTITGNNVCSNGVGIYLTYSSNNNTITGNNVSNNNAEGIDLYDSSNNIITGNTFVNGGLYVYGSYQNTVEDNTVNGKPLVYFKDVSDCKVEDAGQVILVNCTNITVENLDLYNTRVGIDLWETKDCIISNNKVCSNKYGICLTYSSNNNTITGNNACSNDHGIYLSSSSNNNTITGNNVSSNRGGISLSSSSNNKIYFNNFINNIDIVYLIYDSTNIWNSTLEITYTYDGTTYKSYLGNYCDDYEGTDAEGDGIGDTPYSIDSESGDYPLMKPFENYILPRSAPT